MLKKMIFIPILIFLFACTSERPLYVSNSKPVDLGDAVQQVKTDVHESAASVQEHGIASDQEIKKNRVPEVTKVKLVPEIFHPGDTLGIEASGSDADGDPVTMIYEWMVNGESAGDGSSVGVPVQRGDKISVKITPYDGKENGEAVTLDREILNMPPMIAEEGSPVFDGTTYTYQLKASDPDGDSLTYSLKAAPESMKIDPITGLIQWNVPEEFSGMAKVSVLVEDGQGGRSEYDMNVSIKKEAPQGKNM
ncbi:MAG: putative Ig domain-containing protein [bacterium]